ncbi:1-deoxypentalenic acid 11-beta-hydroxylase-like [Mytilus galloprovincialis]|uniref:1-deoxypentalenic acid 11-beta-hydroxylase-like n=1 Tax=Mytilus galloprovincialis TaxID=29158 RepID=UPI003F7BE7C5
MATRTVQLGTQMVEFPSDRLQQLEDCNHLLSDVEALHKEIQTKGYLFIRGLHDRQEVLNARQTVLEYVKEQGNGKLVDPWPEGVLEARCGQGCIPFMEGDRKITHAENIQKVLEGPRPKEFFRRFLGEEPRTFDFKWLRGIYREAFTGVHVDRVYMNRGTPNLYTMWTPFGDVTLDMGCLAVCEGSNSLESFQYFQKTYGHLDVEAAKLKGTGWFTTDPWEITEKFGGQWKTSDFKAGDVLIFTMGTAHMSTANLTDLLRISCDTRWQRVSEKADERYMGDNFGSKVKFGLQFKDDKSDEEEVTIEKLKKTWGI